MFTKSYFCAFYLCAMKKILLLILCPVMAICQSNLDVADALFEKKQLEGFKVSKFPIHEYWLDVGRHDDFKKAQLDILELGFDK